MFAWLIAAAFAKPAAVVIGTDVAPPGRARLRYSITDALMVRDVLVDLGGVARSDVEVLIDPTPEQVVRVLEQVGAKRPDTLLFYYSGHADGQALFPRGQALPLGVVKQALDAVPAKVRIGVVDACRGGGWTAAKGVQPTGPFDVPLASQGTAYLSASSGAEDAHELEVLGGSLFTHHWVGGLRGAADHNEDRIVTLRESFDWARQRTLHDSARLLGKPQNPSFQLALRGRRDLRLTDLRGANVAMNLWWGDGVLDVISLDTGRSVARLEQEPVYLVLPPGKYLARRVFEDEATSQEFEVPAVNIRVTNPRTLEIFLDRNGFQPVQDTQLTLKKGVGKTPPVTRSTTNRMTPESRHAEIGFLGGWWWTFAPRGPFADSTDPVGVIRPTFFPTRARFGVTPRLSVGLLSASVYAGRPDRAEALWTVGLYPSVGVGRQYSRAGPFPELGGSIDLRIPASRRVALTSSVVATYRLGALVTELQNAVHLVGGAGVEYRIGPVLLRPSLGVECFSDEHSLVANRWYLVVGSTLQRGNLSLPLVQVEVNHRTSLDLDIAWAVDDRGVASQRVLFGFTRVRDLRAREAVRASRRARRRGSR